MRVLCPENASREPREAEQSCREENKSDDGAEQIGNERRAKGKPGTWLKQLILDGTD